MASRSVNISVVNTTGQLLTLQSTPPLEHGVYTTTPPPTINQTGSFAAESNGTATGVQGLVVYQIGDLQSQTVTLLFDNPFIGNDAFSAPCNPPNAFNCAATSNRGNNANVTYTLSAG
ncbi:MAG TPA: hypothetical protein VF618_02375 [Thermoanaerobaculia bacterium]